jgi:hypothetical protein
VGHRAMWRGVYAAGGEARARGRAPGDQVQRQRRRRQDAAARDQLRRDPAHPDDGPPRPLQARTTEIIASAELAGIITVTAFTLGKKPLLESSETPGRLAARRARRA